MVEHQGPDLNARAAERAVANHERVPHANPFEEQAVRADFRAVIGVAMIEATNRAASQVEAEHLLLALLFDRRSSATERLAELGLTYETFTEALLREREQTLAAIGIQIPDAARLRAAPRVRIGGPRFSASAKETWERTARRSRARRGRPQRPSQIDFLHSLLSLELGTLPRALALAGIDREAAMQALDDLLPNQATQKKDPS